MTSTLFNFLFSEDGRIGRAAFTIGFVSVAAVGLVAFEVANQIENKNAQGVFVILIVACCLLSIRSLAQKRLHDLGKTIWSSFWKNNIPILGGLLAFYEVFFKQGHTEPNKYGEVPKL